MLSIVRLTQDQRYPPTIRTQIVYPLENAKALCYNEAGDGSFAEPMMRWEVFPWMPVST